MALHEDEQRLVQNQSIFRHLNEEVAEGIDLSPRVQSSLVDFWCECSDPGCRATIPLDLDEYAAEHADRRWFVVVPGHEIPAIEKVVRRTERFARVEKFSQPPEIP